MRGGFGVTLALVGALVSAGRLEWADSDSPACDASPETTVRFVPNAPRLRTDPRQSSDVLVFVNGTPEPVLNDTIVPGGWNAELENLVATDNGADAMRLRFTAGDGHLDMSAWGYLWRSFECDGIRWSTGSATGGFESPREGEIAEAGNGVHVYTAGFWENGTLFYTNRAFHRRFRLAAGRLV